MNSETDALRYKFDGLQAENEYEVTVAARNLAGPIKTTSASHQPDPNFTGQGEKSPTLTVITTLEKCKVDQYTASASPLLKCEECPEGGVCDSSSSVYAKKDFWQSEAKLGKVEGLYKCPYPSACLGCRVTGCTRCVTGHEGPLRSPSTTPLTLTLLARPTVCPVLGWVGFEHRRSLHRLLREVQYLSRTATLMMTKTATLALSPLALTPTTQI
jgi:hypothetical protein